MAQKTYGLTIRGAQSLDDIARRVARHIFEAQYTDPAFDAVNSFGVSAAYKLSGRTDKIAESFTNYGFPEVDAQKAVANAQRLIKAVNEPGLGVVFKLKNAQIAIGLGHSQDWLPNEAQLKFIEEVGGETLNKILSGELFTGWNVR